MTNGQLPPLPEGFELETPVAPRKTTPAPATPPAPAQADLPPIPEGFKLETPTTPPVTPPSPAAGAQAAGGFAPGTGTRGGTSPEQVGRQFGTGMQELRRAQIERKKGLRSPEALSEGLAIRREMQREGITEGAPAGARAAASFAFDPEKGIERALKRNFEEMGLPTDKLDVRKRRIQGRDMIVYTDPRDGSRKAWNFPGVSLADIAGLAGEATVLGPEIAGAGAGVLAGTAGGPAGVTTGGLLGGAGGAFLGELTRLMVGQRMGLNPDMDKVDMTISAAQQAGLSFAGGFAVAGALKLAKRYFASLPDGLDDVTAAEFDDAINRYEKLAADIEARTGEEFPATVGQVLERPDVIEIERRIAREPTGTELRDILQQQRGALREMEAGVQPPESYLSEERLGELIRRRMEEGPEQGLRTLEARKQAASEAVEEAQQEIAALATPQERAAADARRVMEGTETQVRNDLDRAYDLLAQVIPSDLNVNLLPIQSYLLSHAGRRDQELFKSLAPDVSPLLRDLFSPKGRSPIVQERLARGAFPYADFWNSLKTIKSKVRQYQKKQRSAGGLTPEEANEYQTLKGLRNVMEQQREAALRDHPQLAEANEQIKQAYRAYKDKLQRQVADNYLKQKADGTYALRGERMIDSILTNAEATQNLVNAAQTYPQMQPAIDSIRRGARQAYLDKVLNKETGAFKPQAHEAFMADNRQGPSMRVLFGDDIADFNRARSLAQAWADADVLQRKATDRLNKAFNMSMRKWEPSQVVEKLWKPEKLDSLRRLKKLLPPNLWSDFQAAVRARDMEKMTTWDRALQAPIVTAKQLGEYLTPRNAAAIELVHGPQYLRDLRTLEQGLRTTARRTADEETAFQAAQRQTEQKAGAALHITRAMVGMFTTPGRMLTAGIRLNERNASKALIHAMANPRTLRQFVQRNEAIRRAQGNQKLNLLANIYGPTAYEAIFGGSPAEE